MPSLRTVYEMAGPARSDGFNFLCIVLARRHGVIVASCCNSGSPPGLDVAASSVARPRSRFTVPFWSAGSWVGALSLLLGSWVDALCSVPGSAPESSATEPSAF